MSKMTSQILKFVETSKFKIFDFFKTKHFAQIRSLYKMYTFLDR